MNLGDTETLHRGASGVDLFGFRDGGLRLLSYELSSGTFCRGVSAYQVYSLAPGAALCQFRVCLGSDNSLIYRWARPPGV